MADIQVLAKAKVLGCPIDAGFMKSETENIMVVYGKPDPNIPPKGVTITELLDSCNKMVAKFPTEEEIKKKLPQEIQSVFDKVTFQLNEVYFVKKSTDTTSEFAFWLEINTDKLTEGWPIEVESVSIKIWSTMNPKILSEMNISAMQALLASSQNVPIAPAST